MIALLARYHFLFVYLQYVKSHINIIVCYNPCSSSMLGV